ncbi:MAG: hypothetical protein K2M03_05635 [Muribaculaceae bacterium]|nr:hypothetical protein [Muribaculaceae bacterium]
MIIKPKNTDYEHPADDFDDFEDVRQVPAEPKPQKEPPLSPEDPAYWEREESEFEHLKPVVRTRRMWIYAGLGGIAFGLLYALYIILFTTYSEGTIQYGYVDNIERRGEIFKTFEGVMIPYKSIADTVRPYEGDIIFSVNDDHMAAELRRLMLANLPARIEYTRYHAALPWRGESKILITHVDTADPRKIYHPGLPAPHIPTPSK